MNAKKIGEKIRNLRKKNGKSQMDVVREIETIYGEKIGISQTTLSNLEQGKVQPKDGVLEILADYFGVPVVQFYGSTDTTQRGLDLANEYLDKLINIDTSSTKRRFAHSRGLRQEGDEVDKNLDSTISDDDLLDF